MDIAGISWGPPSRRDCARLLTDARRSPLSYDHEGSTLDPARWSAPGVRARQLDVGAGVADFAAARTALQTWVPQRGLPAGIEPDGQPVVVGATVLVVLRYGPCTVVVPDRIVAVVDEPRRFAYAYGTLPGHHERGEESFTVEHRADDTVRATIRVQATTATLLARAARPVVMGMQEMALQAYLSAIAGHVQADRTSRQAGRDEQ